MMEGQTLFFSNNPCKALPSPVYASYHTPPYTFNFASNNVGSSWSDYKIYHPPPSMCEEDDVLQMQQQLRFPTPPITPPRTCNNFTAEQQQTQKQEEEEKSHLLHSVDEPLSTAPLRTLSVIMKINHDQSSHHLPVDLHHPYDVHLTQEDNNDTLLNHHHHHHHHHQSQLHDTPSSGTSTPSSNNDFVCDWIDCGRYFESLELLAIHVTQIHAVASLTDGLYYCRWGGCQRSERGFNARYKMLVHVRTHTKEKPHQCHLCDKRFSRAENLKIHIRSHSGEKPYICTFEGCNKAYSNSSDRFKHTRTHSMEKPYVCKVPGCLKRYTDPSSLRKHVKTFKHSVQIMDSKTTTSSPTYYEQSQQYYLRLPNSLEESRFMPQEQSEHLAYPPYQLFMTATGPTIPAPQDSFCVAMEEMCHIRATLHDYKNSPTTTSSHTDNYWLHEKANDAKNSQLFDANLNAAEISMDLITDKPLDLRVKRC